MTKDGDNNVLRGDKKSDKNEWGTVPHSTGAYQTKGWKKGNIVFQLIN